MWSMVVAAVVVGLGPRPAAFTDPSSAAYSSWLAEKTIAFDSQITGARCDGAVVTSLGGVNAGPPIMKPPPPDEFVGESAIEHLKIEGCGHVRFPNTLVYHLKSGGWRALGLLDGDSHAEPRLQIDAITMAKGLLLAKAPCPADQAAATLRMGAVKTLQPRGADGMWSELWRAAVCGQQVAVALSFQPNPLGPGTTFQVHRVAPDGGPLKP